MIALWLLIIAFPPLAAAMAWAAKRQRDGMAALAAWPLAGLATAAGFPGVLMGFSPDFTRILLLLGLVYGLGAALLTASWSRKLPAVCLAGKP